MFKLSFAPVDLGPSPSDRRRSRLRRRRWHQTVTESSRVPCPTGGAEE